MRAIRPRHSARGFISGAWQIEDCEIKKHTCRQPRRIFHNTLLDLGMQLRHTLIVKRYFAAYQNIQDDTKTPNIDLWPEICLGLEQLWGCKVERATESLQQALGSECVAQAEINDLNVTSLTDENVFDLEVAVHNAVPMAVIKSTCYLAAKLPGLLFF